MLIQDEGGIPGKVRVISCSLNQDLGEGNGTPLQYSCLENPTDGGAWWAAVHGVATSQTRLSDFPFTFHFSNACVGEGNSNPLQCSCLENPRDGGAWWAAVDEVAQSRTRLKRLSNIPYPIPWRMNMLIALPITIWIFNRSVTSVQQSDFYLCHLWPQKKTKLTGADGDQTRNSLLIITRF